MFFERIKKKNLVYKISAGNLAFVLWAKVKTFILHFFANFLGLFYISCLDLVTRLCFKVS